MLKKKSDAFSRFKSFKALVENQQERKIKCLKIDNGIEYTMNEFKKNFFENGIFRQYIILGTPQQNGVTKRMNRTLLDHMLGVC